MTSSVSHYDYYGATGQADGDPAKIERRASMVRPAPHPGVGCSPNPRELIDTDPHHALFRFCVRCDISNFVPKVVRTLEEFAQGNEGNKRTMATPSLSSCMNDLFAET